MTQQPKDSKTAEPKKQEQVGSGGERSAGDSNDSDWRPTPSEHGVGVTPSTAPSGIGSKPHK